MAQAFTWQNPYPNSEEVMFQEYKQIILKTGRRSVIASIDIHEVLLENQSDCYDTQSIRQNSTGHRLISVTNVEKLGI